MGQLIKIAITGPESSGKTMLSAALAKEFSCKWHPEYAREYLNEIDRPYTSEDLVQIAVEQVRRRNGSIDQEMAIYDTDITVLSIWAQEKFGLVPETIRLLDQADTTDLILLCRPDLPWENDVQRENPIDRDRLFALYEAHLKSANRNYRIIEGVGEGRFELAKSIIAEFIA